MAVGSRKESKGATLCYTGAEGVRGGGVFKIAFTGEEIDDLIARTRSGRLAGRGGEGWSNDSCHRGGRLALDRREMDRLGISHRVCESSSLPGEVEYMQGTGMSGKLYR